MIEDSGVTWMVNRDQLNHDWLKNQYIVALGRFLNVVDGNESSQKYLDYFLNAILGQWEIQGPQFQKLINSFEQSLTPCRYFPCSGSSIESQAGIWLTEFAHQMWKIRWNVSSLVSQALAAWTAVNVAYQQVIDARAAGCTFARSAILRREEFQNLSDRCIALSDALGLFPHSQLSV
ncbi:hypothetical protein ACYFX5_26870 [Bremerella sp. T1]|uniref:hypothetical protein n=1 Tax=Bremerella sp. TYQ1 TaxID=3119568 RepID=UPI001CCACAE7|nr:hypothetical protein [Bremerella volcania]UBM36633.1 hypothetical protein LA756_01725 [Bremerella volcania]